MTQEQWAQVRAMDLGDMSDPESAATAAHFIAKVARRPGSKEEVAAFSRAGRACPDVLNKAVASVDRDRVRHVKDEGRIASMESRWREERGKSVKQEAKIMRLQRRVVELEKDNDDVRASLRTAQASRDEEVAKRAGTGRAHAKRVTDFQNQVRNLKLKHEVITVQNRAMRRQLEEEVTVLREKLQTAENAASASDEVYNQKLGALKDKVAALEANVDEKTKEAAESEAAAATLRLRLVRAQLRARTADMKERELLQAKDDVARYERHCRRMTELYGSMVNNSRRKPDAAEASAAEGAPSQAGAVSRRPTAAGSIEEVVRTAIEVATAAVEQQAGPSSGRRAASTGLLPHAMRAVISAEQTQDSDDEITVIAVKRPLPGVVGRKKSKAAGSKSQPKSLGDLTTEPESD